MIDIGPKFISAIFCFDLLVTKVTSSNLRKNMCTLQRAQFKRNLDDFLSECLSQLNLGQEQNWVMSGQKLGHKVKS